MIRSILSLSLKKYKILKNDQITFEFYYFNLPEPEGNLQQTIEATEQKTRLYKTKKLQK